MNIVPIQAIANQAFSIVLDDNRWDFVIKSTNGTISVSLAKNGVDVISALRAVANMKIIPAEYEEAGNFAFVIPTQEVPDYTKFGISQTLIYLTQAELTAVRALTAPPITADYFDPIAPLPLRFEPKGYVLG
jgi:hypothetical protein